MKKSNLTKTALMCCLLVLISMTTYAQKGDWYAGGLLGYSIHERDQNTNKILQLSPEIGTWLTDDIQLGTEINYLFQKQKDTGEFNFSSSFSTFSPSLYIRKYWKAGEKFSIFISANSGIIVSDSDVGTERAHVGFQALLGFGATYEIAPRWTLIGRHASIEYSNTGESKNYGAFLNFSGNPFNLGVYYTFKTGK